MANPEKQALLPSSPVNPEKIYFKKDAYSLGNTTQSSKYDQQSAKLSFEEKNLRIQDTQLKDKQIKWVLASLWVSTRQLQRAESNVLEAAVLGGTRESEEI